MKAVFLAGLTYVLSTASLAAPSPRLELLTRAPDHPHRRGASSLTAAPEISRDGNFILFLSRARNLTTDPDSAVMNLYMTDRRTHVTTLISTGLNGEPANDSVEKYQFSADARKILFETRASNIIPNDTNNATDIFLKDLASNSTILISGKTSVTIALDYPGGYDASMTPDAAYVVFISRLTLTSDDKDDGLQPDIYVRDIKNNVLTLASGAATVAQSMLPNYSPSISDDGRFVAFQRDIIGVTNGHYHNVFIRDLLTQTTLQPGSNYVGACNGWLLSNDGRYLVFSNVSSNTAPTNFVVRFNTSSGATDLISSNTSAAQVITPLAISADASTIVMDRQTTREVWRENLGSRDFPTKVTGETTSLPFSLSDLSLDGHYLTFVTDDTNLVDTIVRPGPQTYVCDLFTTNIIALLSPKNDNAGLNSIPPIEPVINADGSAVAYVAESDGLTDYDSRVANIHVWDRNSGRSELLTTSIPGIFQNTGPSAVNFTKASLSDDGGRVIYSSIEFADPVTRTNRVWKVYVLDRATGERQLVSYTPDDPTGSSKYSFGGMISGDGNVVAYFSRPKGRMGSINVRALDTGVLQVANTNLEATLQYPLDAPSLSHDGRLLAYYARTSQGFLTAFNGDIYTFDRNSGLRGLVSSNSFSNGSGNGPSANPLISPDGQLVAFQSQASNLGVRGQGVWPVFVRRISTGTLLVLSNVLGSDTTFRQMSFNRASTTLLFPSGTSNYYTYNFQTGEYSLACTNSQEADMSEDGRWIAFSTPTAGNPKLKQIYLRDRLNDSQILVSKDFTNDTFGNGNSFAPRVTDDGRYVIFESRASNLVPNDNNNADDIFLYDTATAQVQLISHTPTGASGDYASQRVALTADKSQAIFKSHANDLIPGDYNEATDLFAFTIPGPDIDHDGLDDRWELATFGDLSHDGTGDTDGDGLTDLLEFTAGTNPTQSASILRLQNITVTFNGLDLTWTGVPGHLYRIQSRAALDNSPWLDLTAGFVAASQLNTLHLPQPSTTARYFRVLDSN
jgi:hypothetical protein